MLDVLQEVAKIHYFMRDYEGAYRYYKKFLTIKASLGLDIYAVENAKIAMVMRKVGKEEEAKKYMLLFSDYAANDPSIYKSLNLAMAAAFNDNKQEAIELIRQFSKEENYHYWILLFFELDPLMDEIKTLPAFKQTMQKIEANFWKRHEQIKVSLKEQQLI